MSSNLDTTGRTRLGIPRSALGPLAYSAETAVLGTLCFFASSHVAGTDQLLLWLGWAFLVASAVFAMLFSARSGRLDGHSRSSEPGLRR